MKFIEVTKGAEELYQQFIQNILFENKYMSVSVRKMSFMVDFQYSALECFLSSLVKTIIFKNSIFPFLYKV